MAHCVFIGRWSGLHHVELSWSELMILRKISEERLNEKLGIDFLNSLEFCRGEIDCINGLPQKSNQPKEYDLGYGLRYELEAQLDAQTDNGEN